MRARLALSALACLLSASPALAGLDNVTPSIDEGVGISVHAREPASGPTPQPAINATAACTEIGKKIGTAKVYYPGSAQYANALSHASPASSDASVCVVEPTTAKEVGTVVKIIDASRVSFAVKGGGHIMNPGFSSTKGVHISLNKFRDIKYTEKKKCTFKDAPDGVVALGAGLKWNEVYDVLDPLNVTVAGGRASGVGISGFILGGGYSFWSSQVGLTVDNVVAFELVLPDGSVREVTARDADLFWALKGGGNNFGIVTKFTLKAIPYTQVWGGTTMNLMAYEEVADLIVKWEQTVSDPKAAILPCFIMFNGTPIASTMLFYAAPTPPAGMFDAWLNISQPLNIDIKTRKLGDLVGTTAENPLGGMRGAFHTVTLEHHSKDLLTTIINETYTNAAALAPTGGIYVAYNIEPFASGYLRHNPRTSDTAYPTARVRQASGLPLNLYYAWPQEAAAADAIHRAAIQASADKLQALTGQAKPLERYPNYVLSEATKLEDMYGVEGVKRLRKIANKVDPRKVMTLAGGFKLQ